MKKADFLKMITTLGAHDLAIADGEDIIPYSDTTPEAVFETAQQVPGARILAYAKDELFACGGVEGIGLLPIRCDCEQTRTRVKTYIRHAFDAGAYELADGLLIYGGAWCDDDTAIDFTAYLAIVFGGVSMYNPVSDAYIDITAGPIAGYRRPEMLNKAKMQKLADDLTAALGTAPAPAGWNEYDPANFSIEEFCEKNGIRIAGKSETEKNIRLQTPFGILIQSKEDRGVALVPLTTDAKIQTWEELAVQYDPDQRERARRERMAKERNAERTEYREPAATLPAEAFEDTLTIALRNANRSERIIQTDLTDFDRGWGLKAGQVCIVTGYTGGGKSTLVSQIILSAISHGAKAGLYSGEMSEEEVIDWLFVQAAGPEHVIETANGYMVPLDVEARIHCWLKPRFRNYNYTDFGSNIDRILEKSEEAIKEHKLDLFVFDNLMTMRTTAGKTKFEKQEELCRRLHDFAKAHQVAVILVAHPHKPENGDFFLTEYDLSGAAEIANYAHTIISVYTMDERFDRAYRREYGSDRTANPALAQADNCYAVLKGRRGNKVVRAKKYVLRPLYYDYKSSRLLSSPDQVLRYAWDEISEDEAAVVRRRIEYARAAGSQDQGYTLTDEEIQEARRHEDLLARGTTEAREQEREDREKARQKIEAGKREDRYRQQKSQDALRGKTFAERLGI